MANKYYCTAMSLPGLGVICCPIVPWDNGIPWPLAGRMHSNGAAIQTGGFSLYYVQRLLSSLTTIPSKAKKRHTAVAMKHHYFFPAGSRHRSPAHAGLASSPLIVPSKRVIAPRTTRSLRGLRAVSLVEVMFASGILTMVLLGVLQGSLQSRRMTEGSIRQATCASLVQGYMEQIKSMKYAAVLNALPSSPSVTPGAGTVAAWQAYVGTPGTDDSNPTLTLKDSSQTDTIFCLSPGAAPTTLPDISTLPTNAAKRTESVDIDNIASAADNCTLDMWVWINPLTGTNVQDCKSIVVVYQYTVKDGGRVRYYSDMVRAIRSIVPTDG